jgi:predicted metal-dependent enzyme (double-stranded beta helix superfamily)
VTAPAIDLHPDLPALPGLVHPQRTSWKPRELRDLTSTVTAELTAPLLAMLRFTEPQRWWTRLALTDGVELWLLSWLPGQHTAPHDHGGASGSFTVLLGEVAETYRYPTGPVREQRHVTGAALGFGGGRAHQVRNATGARAATVHAYSPPLVPTREYVSLHDIPAQVP